MYVTTCDHCSVQHQPMRTSFTPRTAVEQAEKDGWYIEHDTGLTLCPECREDPDLTGIDN